MKPLPKTSESGAYMTTLPKTACFGAQTKTLLKTSERGPYTKGLPKKCHCGAYERALPKKWHPWRIQRALPKTSERGAYTKTLPKSATRGTTVNAADVKVSPAAQCGWLFVLSRVIQRKFAGPGFGRTFTKDLMADAKIILKWRSYFFGEGEPEIKTGLLSWLGEAIEETDNANGLTIASARM
jgi:hypothetical protein